ncbi:cupredoxin domain-containing protein [Streptomyces sp. NPDC046915]|uniref:cupredoxin domain-containing protein n=1 Tax=Streptomyces sp. NPDC046915 TaxID=3155257 RepID=UPI0033EC2E6C
MAVTPGRGGAAAGACALALAAVLTACGNSGSGGAGTGSAATPPQAGKAAGTTVTVRLTEYKLTLSSKTFKAGDHTFVAENGGHTVHSLEIEGPGGETRLSHDLEPGQSAQLRVMLKKGSYELYCPVDGHKGLGMKADITVGGGTSGGGGGSSGSSSY